jgi:hypothetical protein
MLSSSLPRLRSVSLNSIGEPQAMSSPRLFLALDRYVSRFRQSSRIRIRCPFLAQDREAFKLLTHILKLGACVYFGEVGRGSSTLIDYFARNGAPQFKPGTNPAEYNPDPLPFPGPGQRGFQALDAHSETRGLYATPSAIGEPQAMSSPRLFLALDRYVSRIFC